VEKAAAEAAEANADKENVNGEDGQKAKSKPEAFNISNSEAIRRLRNKGQPIRLFGESDSERRLRLRALELIEERTVGQQNDFMRAMESMDKGLDLADLQKQARSGNPTLDKLKAATRDGSSAPGSESEDVDSPVEAKASGEQYGEVDLSLVKKNPSKVYPQIYYGIKNVLKEWEQFMDDRPGACLCADLAMDQVSC
jgi:pre-mRNA-splicing factor 18